MIEDDPTLDRLPFTVQPIGRVTVVEFKEPSLMDAVVLEQTGRRLYHLIEHEDRRLIILDFEKVQFLSSQAIGILLSMKKKLDLLGKSKLVLSGVSTNLMTLLKITRLDKVLEVKATQKEALKSFETI